MSTIDSSTAMAKVDADGKVVGYPVLLDTIRLDNPNWSFNDQPAESLMNELGYHVVYPVDRPIGDVAIERDPVCIDGTWQQVWETRSHTDMENAVALHNAQQQAFPQVDMLLSDALTMGFPFTFTSAQGDVVEHVQLRNVDRTNIAGCVLKADRLAALGSTDTKLPFRTFENNTYLCTLDQIKQLSDQAYDAYLVYMQLAWEIKDQITQAKSVADIPSLPSSLSLPEGWQLMFSPDAGTAAK